MALKVEVRPEAGVTVARLEGVGCAELLAMVLDGLGQVLGPDDLLVVDLDDATLTEGSHLPALLSALDAVAPEVRIVCSRLAARRLLRRTPVAKRPLVYATVDQALDRRLSADADLRPRMSTGPAA